MESMSIVIDGPGIARLQNALLPKLKNYSPEVYSHAGGKVVSIAFEKYFFRNSSNLLGVIALDGTTAGRCMAYVVSGGGGTGLFVSDLGAERKTLDIVLEMFEEIGEENGWAVWENKTEPDGQPVPEPVRHNPRDQHRRHGRRSMRVRYHLRGRRNRDA